MDSLWLDPIVSKYYYLVWGELRLVVKRINKEEGHAQALRESLGGGADLMNPKLLFKVHCVYS